MYFFNIGDRVVVNGVYTYRHFNNEYATVINKLDYEDGSYLFLFDNWCEGHDGTDYPDKRCGHNKCFYLPEGNTFKGTIKLVTDIVDTDKLFDQLNESDEDEFSWVKDTLSNTFDLNDSVLTFNPKVSREDVPWVVRKLQEYHPQFDPQDNGGAPYVYMVKDGIKYIFFFTENGKKDWIWNTKHRDYINDTVQRNLNGEANELNGWDVVGRKPLKESDDLKWAEDIVSGELPVDYRTTLMGMKILPGGPNWEWGHQGRNAKYGKITPYSRDMNFYYTDKATHDRHNGYWASVRWYDEKNREIDSNQYRVGPNYYDLLPYNEKSLKESTSDKLSVGEKVVVNGKRIFMNSSDKNFHNEVGTIFDIEKPNIVYISFDNWTEGTNGYQHKEGTEDICKNFNCFRFELDRPYFQGKIEKAPDTHSFFNQINESTEVLTRIYNDNLEEGIRVKVDLPGEFKMAPGTIITFDCDEGEYPVDDANCSVLVKFDNWNLGHSGGQRNGKCGNNQCYWIAVGGPQYEGTSLFKLDYFDYDETNNMFDQINESVNPNLSLKTNVNLIFNPPIKREKDYLDVMKKIKKINPHFKWAGGDELKECPTNFYYGRAIAALSIGYHSENTLTYGEYETEIIERFPSVNGYEWIQYNDVDFDQTQSFFD